jgi:putative ABC transport system permease protein
LTAVLATRLRINGLLAGILVSLGLWTVNLRVMGGTSNLPMLSVDSVLTPFRAWFVEPARLLGVSPSDLAAVFVFGVLAIVLAIMVRWFLYTEVGLALRATGDNERMIRALGTNTDGMKLLGLGLANGLVAVSAALVSQYQGFADVGIGLGMIVAGLASVIIGETLFRPRGVGWTVVAVVLGVVVFRFVIALALFIGLGPNDLRGVQAVIVLLALALPSVRESLGIATRRPTGALVKETVNP